MGEYDCWGDDHEDLTIQVRAKVLASALGGMNVLRLTASADAAQHGHWRVTGIKCSKGHDNSFEGNGVP